MSDWMIDLVSELPKEAPEYLAFVRGLKSAASGKYGCVAHHRIGYRYSQRKVSDYETMPLLDEEHRRLHSKGVHTFEQEVGKTEREMIGETLLEAIRLGVLELNKKRAMALR